MGKQRNNLLAWQWQGYAANHRNPTNLLLHLLAVPLFILGVLLILIGLFTLHWLMLGLGLIGLFASLGLQNQGHRFEEQATEPFSDRQDAVRRLLAEQFVSFPRFVLSGAWFSAWRQRHRH